MVIKVAGAIGLPGGALMFETATNELRDGESFAQAKPAPAAGDAGFWETFKANNLEGWYTAAIVGRSNTLSDAYESRIDNIAKKLNQPASNLGLRNPMNANRIWRGGMVASFDKRLNELADQYPDHRDTIMPDRPLAEDAYKLLGDAQRNAKDLNARYGAFADLPLVGELNLPGITAGLIPKGPLEAAAFAVGPGLTGPGLKGIATGAAKLGGANATFEAAGQPWKQAWLKEAGAEYGWGHAAQEVTGAFAFGFLLDGGIRASWRGGRKLGGFEPVLNDKGQVTGCTCQRQSAAARSGRAYHAAEPDRGGRAAAAG
jgi:hypothetical protein